MRSSSNIETRSHTRTHNAVMCGRESVLNAQDTAAASAASVLYLFSCVLVHIQHGYLTERL